MKGLPHSQAVGKGCKCYFCPLLGPIFGPPIWQGAEEANFPFSGGDKLPVDTEVGDGLILVVLGTGKGAKHKANACPCTFLPSCVTSLMIMVLGWRNPIPCSEEVFGAGHPFNIAIGMILTQTCHIDTNCKLFLLPASFVDLSEYLGAVVKFGISEDIFGSILFLESLC